MRETITGRHEGRRSVRCLLTVPLTVSCDGVEVVRAHTALLRVAWCGGEDLPGLFKLGIELLGVAPDFWGDLYDPSSPPAAADSGRPA